MEANDFIFSLDGAASSIRLDVDGLRPRQVLRVKQLIDALTEGTAFVADPRSDFATPDFCEEFGDHLRLHHNASAIPLTKDKFEYAMVATLRDTGHHARKLGNGNPGADIICDNSPWSLKTQADAHIRRDRIHISKYMELGRGNWETAADVAQLRDRMFEHMLRYERIFTLRSLARLPVGEDLGTAHEYELVEIPKALLERASKYPIEMKFQSRQTPKPASCYVMDDSGTRQLFELYFDGGTERKLQVKNLLKSECIVHATWTFTASE